MNDNTHTLTHPDITLWHTIYTHIPTTIITEHHDNDRITHFSIYIKTENPNRVNQSQTRSYLNLWNPLTLRDKRICIN